MITIAYYDYYMAGYDYMAGYKNMAIFSYMIKGRHELLGMPTNLPRHSIMVLLIGGCRGPRRGSCT